MSAKIGVIIEIEHPQLAEITRLARTLIGARGLGIVARWPELIHVCAAFEVLWLQFADGVR